MRWVEKGLQGHFKTLVGTEFFYYGASTRHHIKLIKTNPHLALNIILVCTLVERMLVTLLLKLFDSR